MTEPHLLVTGGSRGIGAAIVRAAERDGWRVTFTYRERADAAHALESDRVHAVQADVAEAERAASVLDTAEERGPITALVNNAGITGRLGRFEESSIDDLRRILDVNVTGLVALTQAAVVRWKQRGTPGVVVNLSSIAAATGSPGEYVGYAASKAAVETFTRGLGRELAPDGIRVVGVAPGTTETEIHAAAGDPGRPARVAPRIPMGRVAQPDEIASAVVWALSPAASYLTATTIPVAGGL